MRCLAVLFAIVAVAGFATEASAGEKIRLAQSSTVTNCMMTCNSQAATCQTACVVPGTAPTNAATTTSNATASASCQINCSTQATHLSDDLRQTVAFAVIGPASNCRD
jgi:hypothetical protein